MSGSCGCVFCWCALVLVPCRRTETSLLSPIHLYHPWMVQAYNKTAHTRHSILCLGTQCMKLQLKGSYTTLQTHTHIVVSLLKGIPCYLTRWTTVRSCKPKHSLIDSSMWCPRTERVSVFTNHKLFALFYYLAPALCFTHTRHTHTHK